MKRFCSRCGAEITPALEVPYLADGRRGIRLICLTCECARRNAKNAAKRQLEPSITAPVTPPMFEIDRRKPPAPVRPASVSAPKRILFVPDTHVPYHDRRKVDLLHQVAARFRPEIVVILGDFADFYSISDHVKSPNRARVLKDELGEVHSELKRFDLPSVKRKIYVAGNHEDRYDRFINSRAPEFAEMASLRDVLRLSELGWEYVPYKTHVTVGKLNITHDAGKAGRNAHRDAQVAFGANVMIGHTHRLGYEIVGSADGSPHVCAMLGWLGDLEAVDYMHRIRMARDWAHGFGVGYMTPEGVVHVTPVPLVNNACVVNGELFSG